MRHGWAWAECTRGREHSGEASRDRASHHQRVYASLPDRTLACRCEANPLDWSPLASSLPSSQLPLPYLEPGYHAPSQPNGDHHTTPTLDTAREHSPPEKNTGDSVCIKHSIEHTKHKLAEHWTDILLHSLGLSDTHPVSQRARLPCSPADERPGPGRGEGQGVQGLLRRERVPLPAQLSARSTRRCVPHPCPVARYLVVPGFASEDECNGLPST